MGSHLTIRITRKENKELDLKTIYLKQKELQKTILERFDVNKLRHSEHYKILMNWRSLEEIIEDINKDTWKSDKDKEELRKHYTKCFEIGADPILEYYAVMEQELSKLNSTMGITIIPFNEDNFGLPLTDKHFEDSDWEKVFYGNKWDAADPVFWNFADGEAHETTTEVDNGDWKEWHNIEMTKDIRDKLVHVLNLALNKYNISDMFKIIAPEYFDKGKLKEEYREKYGTWLSYGQYPKMTPYKYYRGHLKRIREVLKSIDFENNYVIWGIN